MMLEEERAQAWKGEETEAGLVKSEMVEGWNGGWTGWSFVTW